ncbi:hypothetical protein GCM10010176_036630 [Nonomuraea spiralis]|nr:hypothetical protein GCM10010176_036630 [Nonomuraea spiralis]
MQDPLLAYVATFTAGVHVTRLRPAITVALLAAALAGAVSLPAQATGSEWCTTGPNGPACHSPGWGTK